jgi:predicted XRE-type DNA-binding protein
MALKFYDSPFHATESPEVATKLVFRADLAIKIRGIIDNRGWTQTEAARVLGVSQPRISALVNGRIEGFTLDAMLDMSDTLKITTKMTHDDSEAPTVDARQMVAV